LKPAVQFGIGLVSLGRPWGFRPGDLPGQNEVRELLVTAVSEGVRIFDTAPSYGASEEILGTFLRELSPAVLANLVISTKAGERWDADAQAPVIDHSYDGLRRSIDLSFQRLPVVSVLQVHRPTVQVLRRPEVLRVFEGVRNSGARLVGASVSDLETGQAAAQCEAFDLLQFPYHYGSPHLGDLFGIAARTGLTVWVNRPLGMGRLLYDTAGNAMPAAVGDAYRFVLAKNFRGAVLTGTRSARHLLKDLAAFREAAIHAEFRGSGYVR